MAEAAGGMAVAVEYVGAVAAAVASVHWSWWFSHIAALVYWPVSVIMAPLSFIGRVVLAILSPGIYVASFFVFAGKGVVGFLISLEFGVAALVGSLTGLTVALTSTLLTSQLGLQDSPNDKFYHLSQRKKGLYAPYNNKARYRDMSAPTSSSDDTLQRRDGWGKLRQQQQQQQQRHRRRFDGMGARVTSAGLLSQTIHEEDD
ncbi:hypothetical protein GMORB2_3341 [Geosmithia morbida]|uniref:Uncharacterized protein n=1 Tax=Geosmithia morbida TaxID=1094350 RepID=A0A9P5D373_9HYPO|nr:uncharacterized protein GMORB2_3341 [Geosmithia morbida]KAF4120214.1 hypothetical protein GMORB2_3341 [Geosmithia morbida]